jgi:hypothetical protein
MSRRVTLPGADELFRSTAPAGQPGTEAAPAASAGGASTAELEATVPAAAFVPRVAEPPADTADEAAEDYPPPVRRRPRPAGERRPTGRERHDEKITVYCSAEELIDIERARLTLRGEYGLAADRGRIVREALALVLADLEAKGEQSVLVRRLRGR